MPEKISSSKDWSGDIEFDTYVPLITESASIQDALKLFFFGSDTDGNTYDTTDSIYTHLISLKEIAEPLASALTAHTSTGTNVHGVGAGSSIVGTTTSQTLTNKTINSPLLNNPQVNESIILQATSTDLNKLHETQATAAEINRLSGVTSNIQTQLNAKLGSTDTAVNSSKVGGRTIFVQSSQPTANAVGDIWFQVTGL